VVNAVDNVKARHYVDSRCVFFNKQLFDSGTLGTKCNTQMIIPGATESYSDSKDPPEKQIPMCTLKSFPSQIEHVIQWAREQFDDIFVAPAKFLSEFFANPDKVVKDTQRDLQLNPQKFAELMQSLQYFLPLLRDPSPETYVAFARDYFFRNFDENIFNIIQLFPADYVDKEGKFFWTYPKRPPTPLTFSHEQIPFILDMVKVLEQVVKPKFKLPHTPAEVKTVLAKLPVPERKVAKPEDREKIT